MKLDSGLLLRALEKHARMAQQAVNFARENRKGAMFRDGVVILDEAQKAIDHLKDWIAFNRKNGQT